ncbi:hypothetical protein CCUS01_11103 [Colletotrichum cuscutae]|uniref:Uncharacterized protein n=1 Tax=Colletotrichum cuscutae TaxID=1209917 RepID=A0AAI9U5T9_9PEZI|nr:hypothetical protein CCUS01_11103 [Colletotrichum cuscutae]
MTLRTRPETERKKENKAERSIRYGEGASGRNSGDARAFRETRGDFRKLFLGQIRNMALHGKAGERAKGKLTRGYDDRYFGQGRRLKLWRLCHFFLTISSLWSSSGEASLGYTHHSVSLTDATGSKQSKQTSPSVRSFVWDLEDGGWFSSRIELPNVKMAAGRRLGPHAFRLPLRRPREQEFLALEAKDVSRSHELVLVLVEGAPEAGKSTVFKKPMDPWLICHTTTGDGRPRSEFDAVGDILSLENETPGSNCVSNPMESLLGSFDLQSNVITPKEAWLEGHRCLRLDTGSEAADQEADGRGKERPKECFSNLLLPKASLSGCCCEISDPLLTGITCGSVRGAVRLASSTSSTRQGEMKLQVISCRLCWSFIVKAVSPRLWLVGGLLSAVELASRTLSPAPSMPPFPLSLSLSLRYQLGGAEQDGRPLGARGAERRGLFTAFFIFLSSAPSSISLLSVTVVGPLWGHFGIHETIRTAANKCLLTQPDQVAPTRVGGGVRVTFLRFEEKKKCEASIDEMTLFVSNIIENKGQKKARPRPSRSMAESIPALAARSRGGVSCKIWSRVGRFEEKVQLAAGLGLTSQERLFSLRITKVYCLTACHCKLIHGPRGGKKAERDGSAKAASEQGFLGLWPRSSLRYFLSRRHLAGAYFQRGCQPAGLIFFLLISTSDSVEFFSPFELFFFRCWIESADCEEQEGPRAECGYLPWQFQYLCSSRHGAEGEKKKSKNIGSYLLRRYLLVPARIKIRFLCLDIQIPGSFDKVASSLGPAYSLRRQKKSVSYRARERRGEKLIVADIHIHLDLHRTDYTPGILCLLLFLTLPKLCPNPHPIKPAFPLRLWSRRFAPTSTGAADATDATDLLQLQGSPLQENTSNFVPYGVGSV